ncbi:MAG TPA: ROK family transcriptional regulator [Pseudonocardiaceae bacterium]
MIRSSTGTLEEVRRHNLATVLRLLHVHGPLSRAGLTARTGLNRSTVRALVTELAGLGLVAESSPVSSGTAGRPSIMVQPASDNVHVLAVDIGVEHLTAARVGLGGVILDRTAVERWRSSYDVDVTLRHIATMRATLEAGAPAHSRCVGIGVAVCGLVGSDTGVVRFAPNLGWVDVPLGALLADTTTLPVAVGNEGDLGARAEHLRGAGAGTANLVYLTGEVGLGAGIIVGGRPLAGADGYAGEVGHTRVNPGGRECRCGRRGCWETEVGEDAVLRATGLPAGTSMAEVMSAYAAGAPGVRAGLATIGAWLGAGVADLVNVFNPELVIFAGLTHQLFQLTEPTVRSSLDAALNAPRGRVRLTVAGLGTDSALLGAAELAFAPVLANPLAG